MNTAQFFRWQVLAERRLVSPDGSEHNLVYHRIVGLRRDAGGTIRDVALLNLTENARLPVIVSSDDIQQLILNQRWLLSEYDPCVPKIRCREDIPPKWRERADNCLTLRIPAVRYIDDQGWNAFIPETRSRLLREASERSIGEDGRPNFSSAWIRKLLLAFWRSGGSGFSLVPQCIGNGALGRNELIRQAKERGERVHFGRKRGPKPKSSAASLIAGPEVTPELYQRIVTLLPHLLSDKTLQPALCRSFDRHRRIPWKTITDQLNAKLCPRIVGWGNSGPKPEQLESIRLLTRSQIKSIGSQVIHAGDFVIAVKSWKQVALDHHLPRGDVRDVATRPGERYETDIAEVDAFFVHDGTLLPIGRIFIAFVVDCFSRIIAAAYPWAGDPDVRMITYALAAAAMPKSEWGRLIGETFTDDEWPVQGLPEAMVCDNGEAATHGLAHLPELVFDVVPNPPSLAYLKPNVETGFRLANGDFIDFIPASTKGPRERGSPDPQKRAVCTIAAFTRQINRWVCSVANHRPLDRYPEHEDFLRERATATPIELWRLGCRLRGGALKPYVRERHLPALMESAMARIAPEGIELDGIYYDFDDTNRPQWLESKKVAATAGPCEQVRAHFDRMTVNWIYLVPKNPKWPIVQVPLSRLSRQWENYSRREYELAREFRTGAQKIARHHHDVRKIAFTQSLAAETAAAESAVRVKYGSLHRRNAVADSLGQQSAVREQISADAERDQLLHEAISTPRANCETATQANAMTYDNLLGLK